MEINEKMLVDKRIRVGDLITDITQRGQIAMDSRDPSRAQRFMVTAIDEDGTVHLKPVWNW